MAIQKINLGTEPLGEGGDTYRSANTKINENFSNPDHAASRLVGTNKGDLVLKEDIHAAWADHSTGGGASQEIQSTAAAGTVYMNTLTDIGLRGTVRTFRAHNTASSTRHQTAMGYGNQGHRFAIRFINALDAEPASEWAEFYSNKNTTKDSKTNLLLASGSELPEKSVASKLIDVGLDDMSVNANVLKNGIYRQIIPTYTSSTIGDLDIAKIALGDSAYVAVSGAANSPPMSRYVVHTHKNHNTNLRIRQIAYDYLSTDIYTQVTSDTGIVQHAWAKLLSTGNTKLDTNGAYAPSSPTIDLYSDHIECNADAEKMNPEFIRNGLGDYTIKNTTGLRENDGWYIKIPNDKYGNPKVMAEIERLENGDLNIKTYGRRFDFEIAGVVPDLDNPQDIPEGRWIDLRFNDLPEDLLDEPELETEDVEVEEPEVVDESVEEPEVVEEVVEENPVEESE